MEKSLEGIMSTGSRVNKTKRTKKNKIKKGIKIFSIYLALFVFGAFVSHLIVNTITLDRLERKILRDVPLYIRKDLEPFMR